MASISDTLVPVPVRPAVLYFKTSDDAEYSLYRIYKTILI